MKGITNSIIFLGVGLAAGAAVGGMIGWERAVARGAAEKALTISAVASSGGSDGSGGAPVPGAAGTEKGGGAGAEDAKKDGDAAVVKTPQERLLGMVNGKWDIDTANGLLDTLSENELADVIAQATSRKGQKFASSLKYAAYRAWTRKHPEAALAYAKKESGTQQEKMNFQNSVLSEWALQDGNAALKQAMGLDSPGQRSSGTQRVIQNWASKDQKAVLEYLTDHPELPGMSQLMYYAFSSTRSGNGKVDYAQQMALMDEFVSGGTKVNVMSSTMTNWATEDPAAALAYALKLPAGAQQAEAMESVYQSWAGADLQGAMRSAEGIADPQVKAKALEGIYNQWLQADPLAAVDSMVKSGSPALMETLSNRSYMFYSVLTEQETTDLVNRLPEGNDKQQVINNLIGRSTSDGDYSRSVDMIKLLPDASQRENSLFNVASQWGNAEPAEVEAWIKDIPQSAERDAVVAGYVASLAQTDLATATTWMETLPDGSKKQGAKMNIAYMWMRTAPADAEAWMVAQGLNESDIANVKSAAARGSKTTFIGGGSFRTMQ